MPVERMKTKIVLRAATCSHCGADYTTARRRSPGYCGANCRKAAQRKRENRASWDCWCRKCQERRYRR